MKIIVSDASSLILLSKASVLEKACARYEVFIPSSVEKEVTSSSLRTKYADAVQIHDLIRRDVLRVRRLTSRRTKIPLGLGIGEADAIRLFQQLPAQLLLTDDGKAVKVCRMMRIPFTISPKIVVDLYHNGDITFDEGLLSMEKLRIYGRYSPDIIAEALLKIRQEKDNA